MSCYVIGFICPPEIPLTFSDWIKRKKRALISARLDVLTEQNRTEHVMLYNRICVMPRTCVLLCYITCVMLCYILWVVLCYITCVMLCYITYVMLCYRREKNMLCYITCVMLCLITCVMLCYITCVMLC